MNTNNMNEIQKLLSEGHTPEAIYKFALEEVAAQNKAKAEEEAKKAAEKKALEKKKQLEAARTKTIRNLRNLLVRDYKNYMQVLFADKLTDEDLAVFQETLDRIEKIADNFKDIKADTSPEAKLERLLRDMGF